MHNPVRFVDPTGLFGVPTSIADMLQEREAARQPITITRNGDNVSIVAHVNIWGSGADNLVHGSDTTTHRQAAIYGIRTHWTGDKGGLNVTVTVIELNSDTNLIRDGQQFLNIEIIAGAGTSHVAGLNQGQNWSRTNVGDMVLFTEFESGTNRTLRDVRWTAAHEFGHSLGIADGWGFGREGRGREATEFGNYYSMMIRRNHTVTRLDIELALRAHRTNAYQIWYNNPLVPIHGIPR